MSQPVSSKPVCHKGILLAGGLGTRLFPLSRAVNKHLMPVFNKPMIYYPLSTLMLSGIREILVISDRGTVATLQQLLGDGRHWGIDLSYAVQNAPNGIAEALLIGDGFISNDPFALILGDNIFYGHALSQMLIRVMEGAGTGATVFAYQVADPWRYGVVTFDEHGKPNGLLEKPDEFISEYAVTGLYVFEGGAVDVAKALDPSDRGELEITDINKHYLDSGQLRVEHVGRGYAWFDAGTVESLSQASNYIEIIESRQGVGVAYPEEVALRMGYIDVAQYEYLVGEIPQSSYRDYLENLRLAGRT